MSSRVADSEWVMESAPSAGRTAWGDARAVGLARLSDERLAQLVKAGRERAFAALYERYHRPLYRYCHSLLRSDTDAQDVVQSTFAAAFAAMREGRRNAPLRPWLFRIAHNEAISLLRRRRGGAEEFSDSLLPPVPSAADQADDRARMALLVADLGELPERQRGALVMRELNGLSHADIAVALGTSVGAAKQAIFEARSALMELAEGRALACEEVRRLISDRDGRALRGRRLRAHLRDCSSCAAFAAAIPARRGDLQALAPLLPAGSSAALFARLVPSASAPGAGGGAGSAATAAGFGKLGSALLASKGIVAVAVVAGAAGVGGITKALVLDGVRGSSGTNNARRMPSAFAVSGGRQATAAGSAALGGHPEGGPASRGRSASRPGVRAISAGGSTSLRAPASFNAERGSGSVSAAHLRTLTGAGSGRAAVRRQRTGSRGEGVTHSHSAAHRPGALERTAGSSHSGHHATRPINASHGAGPHGLTPSQPDNSGRSHAGGSGSVVRPPAPVSPPQHPSSSSTTTTTTPTTPHGSNPGGSGQSHAN
jgi:RNA polymerase sigma factor (sigma-70 family)